jgi:hypothetical protein
MAVSERAHTAKLLSGLVSGAWRLENRYSEQKRRIYMHHIL